MPNTYCHYCGKPLTEDMYRYIPDGVDAQLAGLIQTKMMDEKDIYDVFCCKECNDKGLNNNRTTGMGLGYKGDDPIHTPEGYHECSLTNCMHIVRRDGYRVLFCSLSNEKAQYCHRDNNYTPIPTIQCPICHNPFEISIGYDASKEDWYASQTKDFKDLGCNDIQYGQLKCNTCNRYSIFALDCNIQYDKSEQLKNVQNSFAQALITDNTITIRTDGTGNDTE